nr:hypothetical protein HmN_000411600 [Hymenolepis microstoma]
MRGVEIRFSRHRGSMVPITNHEGRFRSQRTGTADYSGKSDRRNSKKMKEASTKDLPNSTESRLPLDH